MMTDTLGVINKTIGEHHSIRESLKHTGAVVTDIGALFALNKEYARWSQSSVEELKDKQGQLLEAVASLEQGLKQHFASEERELPPLLGEVLMKTLIHEHGEIVELFENAKASLTEGTLGGLDQPELLARKAKIQGDIHHIIEAVEEHAKREETILEMIKKTLEGSSPASS
jgi:hypothetical protein